ncbi:MAG: ComF family protein [Eubacterium sp.]|nr:ComF family protein [Eubacterium sp.]
MERLLRILYTPRCVVCGKSLGLRGLQELCEGCRDKVKIVRGPRCMHCSKPIYDDEQEFCGDCRDHASQIESGMALLEYNEAARKIVARFKYEGDLDCGIFFTDRMVDELRSWIEQVNPDIIIPVPVHRTRLRYRGFNQAEVMARRIGERMDIPVDSVSLRRISKTLPQKNLDRNLRYSNLRKSLEVDEKFSCSGRKSVLLVDDIYTTGATLEACASVLKQNGATQVNSICMCIGCGDV